ncbi:MAG: redoxin domain-containing protein [Bdellovibrionales bacterium]|nr:redoxin domain-containing protein [Bdellovibrionales bacterium]
MIKKSFLTNLILGLVVALTSYCQCFASPGSLGVGDKAPLFTLSDQDGAQVQLSDFKGKIVVLEWTNPDCPFVKRHYATGTSKALEARYREKGVVWLAINSTSYMSADESRAFKEANQLPYKILSDFQGNVGRLYGAKTTPHLFVIDQQGAIVYQGAYDDDPRGENSGSSFNYVAAALDSLFENKSVERAETQPYGCSVKYAS